MNQALRTVLTLATMLSLAAPSFAQDAAAAPAAAPAEAAPAAAPAEAAPAAAPAEAAPAEAAPAEAAPAEAAAPAPAPVADEAAAAAEEDLCLAGELCFGPVLSLGLVNVIGLGIHARYGEYWGFGLDYQFFGVSVSDVDASISLLTLGGRFYPFAGSFFLGAGFSYQSASLEASASASGPAGTMVPVKVEGSIGIPQIQFGLGFMGHDGFVMGIDLALGIPLGSSDADFSVGGTGFDTDPDVEKTRGDIDDAADKLVNMLPVTFQVNLLRIGYLF